MKKQKKLNSTTIQATLLTTYGHDFILEKQTEFCKHCHYKVTSADSDMVLCKYGLIPVTSSDPTCPYFSKLQDQQL